MSLSFGVLKIAHHQQVLVLHRLALGPTLDPVAEQLKLALECLVTVAPPCVQGDGEEIEIASTERG